MLLRKNVVRWKIFVIVVVVPSPTKSANALEFAAALSSVLISKSLTSLRPERKLKSLLFGTRKEPKIFPKASEIRSALPRGCAVPRLLINSFSVFLANGTNSLSVISLAYPEIKSPSKNKKC